VEEASGGDVSVDTLDRVNLTYNIRNVTGADIRPLYGFTVKNKKAANDDADDTCYFRGKTWSYEESSYKADSYSSRIYSILPTETDPTLEDISVYTQAGTPPGEMAQKFKPPHSHFLSGDVWCGLSQRADDGIARSEVFRIAGPDTANTPAQLNVIANLIFQKPGLSWPTGTLFSDLSISNDYVMLDSTGASIDSFDLDTTKFYWLINAQVNYHIGTFPIYYARSTRRTSLTGATKWETPNAGESTNAVSSGALNGWAASGDTHPLWFSMPRRRSLSIVMWDPKAMNNYGYGVPTTGGFPVDSLLPAAPSFIKTKDQWYKWMQFQFYDMVKPRSNFSLPKVSAPNIPILPGDILILNDSVLGWSGPGNEPIICRQGDIKYQWSEFDGGGKRNQSESVLTLNPVGLPARYK